MKRLEVYIDEKIYGMLEELLTYVKDTCPTKKGLVEFLIADYHFRMKEKQTTPSLPLPPTQPEEKKEVKPIIKSGLNLAKIDEAERLREEAENSPIHNKIMEMNPERYTTTRSRPKWED